MIVKKQIIPVMIKRKQSNFYSRNLNLREKYNENIRRSMLKILIQWN